MALGAQVEDLPKIGKPAPLRGVKPGRGRASVLASASTRSTPHSPNSTTFTISGSRSASSVISCRPHTKPGFYDLTNSHLNMMSMHLVGAQSLLIVEGCGFWK